MPKGLLLALALVCSTGGMAWLALAMDVHWRQARATQAAPKRATAMVLRMLGAVALALSLVVCLRADHASMAVLVWIMSLATGALLVALALAWRPRWLAWIVAWAG